ncbi:MAG: MATE family efflux transporter [Clostridiales bacterium]|nr:MATE family efflux transporter [Clostridiales bacterium]
MTRFSKNKSFYKIFFTLTASIALQNFIIYAVNLADNVMLGAYSQTALSGVALVNQFQFLLQMLITGVSEGIIVLASQYWGQKNISAMKKISSVGMLMGLIISIGMMVVTFTLPEQCLYLLTNDAAVVAEGAKYLRIVCFTYPIFAITNVLICTLRSAQTVKIGFIVSASALVFNIILNYVLIYGKLFFPAMGVRGAAVATLISRIIEIIVLLFYIIKIDKKLNLKLKDYLSLDKSFFRDYVKTAVPVILSSAVWGVAMGVQTAILGHMGDNTIAANSIATTIFQIVTVVTYGSANAAGVIIGKTIGQGDIPLAKQYSRTMQLLFLGIGITTGLVLFAVTEPVLHLYKVTAEALILSRHFCHILSITVVGTAYQMAVHTGIVRGGGDTRFVLIVDSIFMWLIVLPISAIAAFKFNLSPVIVFICLKSDQILKCAVAVVKVNRYTWIKKLTR